MVQPILTPQTMQAAKQDNSIPNGGDSSVSMPTLNTYYQFTTNMTTSYPLVAVGDTLIIKLTVKNSNGINFNYEIRGNDGTTVLGSFTNNSTSYGSRSVNIKVTADNIGLMNGLEYWVRCVTANSMTAYIQQNTIVFWYAAYTNITDLTGKMHVTEIKWYSAGTSEGTEGRKSQSSDSDFTSVTPNRVMNGITWSGNSGNTIFGWSGYSIGVIP